MNALSKHSGKGFVLSAVAASLALACSAASWIDTFGLTVVLSLAAIIFLLSLAGRLMGGDDA